MSRGLCAYAITRDDAVVGEGMELVAHHGLGLVVSEVELAAFADLETDPAGWLGEPAEDDPLVVLARRHDDVVRAVFEHDPVLPLRFGTVVRDREAAEGLLAQHHESAVRELDRVTGHREWGVRARFLPPAKADDVPLEGLSGTEYLARRRQRLTDAERTRLGGADAAEALHAALAGWATDVAARTRRSTVLLLDNAYLVPTGREQEFHAEVERARGEGVVAVEVTGPWPPYSFARLELADGGEAEAIVPG